MQKYTSKNTEGKAFLYKQYSQATAIGIHYGRGFVCVVRFILQNVLQSL
jgi:hypothetical protein